MPAIDEAGRRLRCSALHLAALGRATRATTDDDPASALPGIDQAHAELIAAGFVHPDGALHPLVADLATATLAPTCKAIIETVGPQGPSLTDVVVSGSRVWLDEPWPGAGPNTEIVRRRSDLSLLMADLVRATGLRPGVPAAIDETELVTDAGALEAALTLLADAHDAWDDAKAVAITRADPHQTRWMTVLAALRCAWRITVFWGDPQLDVDSAVVRSLAVLDAGDEGYWIRTLPAEPLGAEPLDPATPVRLEAASTGAVWEGIGALLPTAAELQTVVAATEAMAS